MPLQHSSWAKVLRKRIHTAENFDYHKKDWVWFIIVVDELSLTVSIPLRQMKDIDSNASHHGPVFSLWTKKNTKQAKRTRNGALEYA